MQALGPVMVGRVSFRAEFQEGEEGEVPQEVTICPPCLPLSSGDSSALFTRTEHRFNHKPFFIHFKCLKAKCRKKMCSAS